MKTIVVLAVSIVLVSMLFCPMVMAAPSMPADLQIVQPDPSLPKELSAFFGKWEGSSSDIMIEYFLIVEKIDEEKASVYLWRGSRVPELFKGWERYEAKVIKDRGKYKLLFRARQLTLKGEYLDYYFPAEGSSRLTRAR